MPKILVTSDETRICKDCNLEKSIEDFPRTGKKWRLHTCKECTNKKSRDYWNSNSEELNLKRLAKAYGLTVEELQDMYDKRVHCAICGKEPSGRWGKLHVDHDHLTGKVRGLLCNECNLVLGLIKDNSAVLNNMIYYIESSK